MSHSQIVIVGAFVFVSLGALGCSGQQGTQTKTSTKVARSPPPPPPPPGLSTSQTQKAEASPAQSPNVAVAASPPISAEDSPQIQAGDFTIKAPDGFVPKGKLLYHERLRTSIQFAFAPRASYATTASEFTSQALAREGMKLLNKEDVTIGDTPGILVLVAREAKPQNGLILVFGSGQGVAQITMIYPADTDESMKKSLRNAMLSIRHQPSSLTPYLPMRCHLNFSL